MNTQQTVTISKHNHIGILTIDYPPVNALSQSVRQGLIDGLENLENDNTVKAIVLQCQSRTFIAGADIKEFGKPPTEPLLPCVVNRIEDSTKPVVAAIFGTSLGGGFEVALACHYRVALADAKIGLPEVNLGLIPGAGGTQRLPRIVGAQKALEMVTSGKHYGVSELANKDITSDKGLTLFDAIFEANSDLLAQTLVYVEGLINSNNLQIKRVGEQSVNDDNFDWSKAITTISKKARGKEAPVVAANILFDTKAMGIKDGMKLEREAFLTLRQSEQSAALRYAFSIEKIAAKTDFKETPLAINNVGVIGGGNMGSGIATAFLAAGFNLTLIEQNQAALDSGVERIKTNFKRNLKSGRINQKQMDTCLDNLIATTDYHQLGQSELVVEAIFEDLAVKKQLFAKLEKVCNADCILATNTSYLDINAIADVIKRPQQVIGMHFFSPANIMKLVEVVQADKSSKVALISAMAVVKKLNKISVLVGVCFGFAGNRMYTRYGREIQQMLLEGAKIEQIDQAMTTWGMAMGPLAVQDLSGIDIGHNARSAQPFPEYDPGYFRAAATMVENNRLGRKTGQGFYRYDQDNNNGSKPEVDPVAADLIRAKAAELGIKSTEFNDEIIVERALLALISEGLSLYKEGIVQRLSDIDVVWLHGYGFPRHKGGPMFQAIQIGKDNIALMLERLRSQQGSKIWPEVDLSLLDELSL
jgi:3-hydroxyacyl-CoA dehydrogenase